MPTIPLLPSNPDQSGNVFWDDYANVATNDVFRQGIWRFQNSGNTIIKIMGAQRIPADYIANTGQTSVFPIWTTTSTAGITVWGFAYRVVDGNNSASMDQTSLQELVLQQAYAPSAANNRMTTAILITAANLVAGATLEFWFFRDKGSANENLGAATILHHLDLSYATG